MQTRADQTLFEWMEVHARNHPDAVALIHADGVVTFGELAARVKRLATGLAEIGVEKGDIVAAQLPNCPEFVTAFLATAARGAIFQTLHMPYHSSELAQLLGHSKAKIAIALSNFKDINPASEIVNLSINLPNLESIISVGSPVAGTLSYDTLIATSADTSSIVPTSPDDHYLLLYTSGTTSSPKGVPHTYRGFLGNSWTISNELSFGSDERLMSLAPFTHLYGLMTVHMALATGSASVLLSAFNPPTLIDEINESKPTAIFAAPAHFAPFMEQGSMTSEVFSATKLICLSGSTVPPRLALQVDTLLENGSVIQLWGMSELQAGAYGRPGDTLGSRTGTTGQPSPGTEFRIVGEDGSTLALGSEGPLEVRGPSVFSGYLDNAEETEDAFSKDGWFKTGDLAIVDPNGDLRLTGRTKELINRGGVKYNPVEVELLLADMPQIEACAVVAIPDAILGEKACLCVQLMPGHTLNLDEVLAFLKPKEIAKYKLPEWLAIVDALPLTPTRKVMRKRLTATILEKEAK